MPLTLEEFTYGFVNTFTPEDAKAAYEKYYVPETGQIFYEAGFANFHLHPPTELHFKYEERAPLLIIGADQDHTVPASVAKKQFKKYEQSPAQTDYLEFAGRPHLMMNAEKWAEIAGAIGGGMLANALGRVIPNVRGVHVPLGAVFVWSLIRPHDYFTWFLEVVPAIAGFATFTTTCHMIWNSFAPSTRAASTSSLGMVRKNCRRRKIENASPRNAGTIKGLRDPIHPICLKSRNSGTIVT